MPDKIESLKNAMLVYLNQKKGLASAEQTQRIEGLINSLYMELERLQKKMGSPELDENLSKEEELASMMLKVSNVLRKGNVSVCREVADEFLKALELFELAREAKEAGKLAAIKDRYQAL